MAYPSASDWTSNAPFSAWYVEVRQGQPSKVCQTDGWNFLRDLQEQLHTRLQDSGPLQDPNGQTITADDVIINDVSGTQAGWNAPLLSALYAVARRDGAPAAYLSTIASDLGSVTISPATLSTAVWEAYLNGSTTPSGDTRYGAGSPDEVRIPTGSVMPGWLAAPNPPSSGVASSGLTCRAVPSVPALQPLPGGGLGFLHNPWVLAGTLVVATIAVVVVARNVPALRPA